MRNGSAIFMSHNEAIMCLSQIVTLRGCKERMGAQKGINVASTVVATVGEKAHLRTKRH